MDMNEYQRLAGRTAVRLTSRDAELGHAALGLCGEAGELAEVIKKHIYFGQPLDLPAARKELGDALWYVAYMADLLGADLSEVAKRNITKLQTRYPEKFSTQDSIERRDTAHAD